MPMIVKKIDSATAFFGSSSFLKKKDFIDWSLWWGLSLRSKSVSNLLSPDFYFLTPPYLVSTSSIYEEEFKNLLIRYSYFYS